MKNTGIIYSGTHPVDILAGRKDMTRRTRGLEEINVSPMDWLYTGFKIETGFSFLNTRSRRIVNIHCPYGYLGDHLYGRETWRAEKCYDNKPPREIGHSSYIDYVAGGDEKQSFRKLGITRPSIFMPRWASRIEQEITYLAVAHVRDISEEDAKREGMSTFPWWDGEHTLSLEPVTAPNFPSCYRNGFAMVWDRLNKKRGYGWDRNCWVWVIGAKLL